MWRPEGKRWREKRNKYLNKHTMLAISVENMDTYEAGADAILEALFKMAKESPTGTFVIDSNITNIFNIPDEK